MPQRFPPSRQLKLPEVGPQGQARIQQATCSIAAEPLGEPTLAGPLLAVAQASYLERAGVGEIEFEPRLSPAPFPHAEAFLTAEAQAFAHGSWLALLAIRQTLGLSES
jgi:hypothetical protein